MVERSPFVVLEFRRWSLPRLGPSNVRSCIATHKTVQSMQHPCREHSNNYVLTSQEGVSFNDSSVEHVEV
eukprot:4475846-Amphidinium_carterae.1